MIHFLPYGAAVGDALSQSYSFVIVVLSYLIAALASYAGLLMSVSIANAESARARWAWLAGGSTAMGIGIWAMHFTGMLALTLPVPINYDVPITILSVVPAILASALALRVMSGHGNRHRRYLIGGTLVGAGIGAMHYIGMAAMRVEYCVHPYNPGLFVLSVIVAVVLGIAAFYSRDLVRYRVPFLNSKRTQIIVSAGLMGLAITGMHYTAMAAVEFIPSPLNGLTNVTVDTFWLSIGVAAVAVIIVLLAIVATIVGRAFQATTRRARVDRSRIIEAIESISEGFILFDDDGRLSMCNHVLHEMYPALDKLLESGTQYKDLVAAWADLHRELPTGVSAEAYVAESLRNFKEHGHTGEPREDRLADGRWIYVREHSIEHGGLAAVFTDVTPIKKLQAVYEKLASQDALTGLMSRRLFEDRLDHAIALAKRLRQSLSLLYIDLDNFKPINDSFGHDAGDAVLKEVALRLRKTARDSDTVARLGGDEFAVLMESDSDRMSAGTLATRIISALSQPIFAGGRECHVGASIGVAVSSPSQTVGKETLMKAADEAMYDAKKAGGGHYRVHDDLLGEDQFEIAFQPAVARGELL
jgi:diguanylate cyclase (GGDEF)-like protein